MATSEIRILTLHLSSVSSLLYDNFYILFLNRNYCGLIALALYFDILIFTTAAFKNILKSDFSFSEFFILIHLLVGWI